MNIGPSDKFQAVINDFHVTFTDSPTFYVNCTLPDPPPPTSKYFGYSGASPFSSPSETTYFSVNGSDLSNTVGQDYLSFVVTSATVDPLTITKQSGYSGNVTTKSSFFEDKDYSMPSQSFWRFQSDTGVPLRIYRVNGVSSFLLTQVQLIPDLELLLLAGKYSKIRVNTNQGIKVFQPECPASLDHSLTSSTEVTDPIVPNPDVVFYVLHDPSII